METNITMDYCTSIHCMDGRIQEPIQKYLKKHYGIKYVDTITEAEPCKILSENKNQILINSILERIQISINYHKSKLIFMSGHYDCVGNRCSEDDHKEHIKITVEYLKNLYPELEIFGLWIDNEWKINNV